MTPSGTSSSLPAPPSAVSNSFVKQYYHLLTCEPETLHRFYKDESCLSRCEGTQIEYAIKGQKAINEKILSIGYHNAHVDLESGSVDCQESHDGSVIVMVTGILTLQNDQIPRPFVQTFFLATQPLGFFVLNDMFRFLDTKSLIKQEVQQVQGREKTGAQQRAQPGALHQKNIGTTKSMNSPKTTSVVNANAVGMTNANANANATKIQSQIRSPRASALSDSAKTTTTTSGKNATEKDEASSHSRSHSPNKKVVTSPRQEQQQKTVVGTTNVNEGIKSPKQQQQQSMIKSPKQEKTKEMNQNHKEEVIAASATVSVPSHSSPKRTGTIENQQQQGKKHHQNESSRQNQENEQAPSSTTTPAFQGPVTWASKLFTGNTVASTSSSLPVPASSQSNTTSAQPPMTAPPVRKPSNAAGVPSSNQPKSVGGYKQYSQQSGGGKPEKFRPPLHAGAATLYIRNLPEQTKEEDLLELFGTYGPIANVNLNLARNFAFVDYANVESMKKAVSDDCKFIIYDTQLHVEERNAEKKSNYRQGNSSRGRNDRDGRGGNTRKNNEGSDMKDNKQHDNRSKNDKNSGKRNASVGYKQNESGNRS